MKHALSKFGGDPCPARNHGSGQVLCAKSTFFLVLAANRNDPSLPTALLAGFSTMEGNPVLLSVFWYDNSWPKQPFSSFPFVALVSSHSKEKRRLLF